MAATARSRRSHSPSSTRAACVGGCQGTSNLLAGRLLGLNLAYLVVAMRGLPREGGSLATRALRILLGIALAAVALRLTPGALPGSAPTGGALGELLVGAVPPFVMLTGTVLLGRKLGWYGDRARSP